MIYGKLYAACNELSTIKEIPGLILDETPAAEKFYGKYGDLRRTYLRERKPKLWMVLVNTGKADDHLTSIEREAEQRMDTR